MKPNDRRYTTEKTIRECLHLIGERAFDLDVAADAERHCAPLWFVAPGDDATGAAGVDGLAHDWAAPRVWCNPPFSDIEPWVEKAWEQITNCHVIAMLVPANRTEQPWFQRWVEPFRDNRFARPIPSPPPETEGELREFIESNVALVSDGCWKWQRYTLPKGHGRIRWRGRMELAHRLAYRAWVGEPGDLFVCHRCDVPDCVNPHHLFLGTHRENMRDRNAKGRTARGERAGRSLPRSRVELIRWLASCGVRRANIAREVGVSSSTVSRILDGKRWSTEPSADKSPGVVLETHFLSGRVRFGSPGNPTAQDVGSPPFGCVLLVWRRP